MILSVSVAMTGPIATIAVLFFDPAWVPHAAMLVLWLAVVSLGTRAVKVSDGVARLVQFVALLAWMSALALLWQEPTETATGFLERIGTLLRMGAGHIQQHVAPMPPNPGALWLLLALIGWLYIITELLAITLEQPGWTITSLSVPFLVPAIGLNVTLPWWLLALIVGGYALILATDVAEQAESPRNLVSDSSTEVGGRGGYRLGALLAVPALGIALVLAATLPVGNLDSLLSSSGNEPLELGDPSIDLSSNLNHPTNPVLITYTTTAPAGVRLRLTALPVLDASGARLETVQIQSGALPALQEHGDTVTATTQVSVREFKSEYLPAPYAILNHSASGEWGWEQGSRSVLATGANRKSATVGLSYEVNSRLPAINADVLATAQAGSPADAPSTSQMPPELPASIAELAAKVTAGADTAGKKALAIEAFLRDSTRFRYTTQAPSGVGYEVLERFLTQDRAGYCVHFATAMTAMSRASGIPSRVAIGFLPGTQQPDGSWQVNAHNMHAWPELYFDGLGWVPFEPTAAVSSSSISNPPPPAPTAVPTPIPTADPTTQTTMDAPEPSESPTTGPTIDSDDTPVPGRLIPSWWPLALAGLGVLAVLGSPAALRWLIRRRRLSAIDQIEPAWDEVQATWLDIGKDWPQHSPRALGQMVAERYPVIAGQAMDLALLVERSRYAPDAPPPAEASALAATVSEAIRVNQTRGVRLKTVLWPRSLWLLRRTTLRRRSRDMSQGGIHGPLR